jgi:hypothetical protein
MFFFIGGTAIALPDLIGLHYFRPGLYLFPILGPIGALFVFAGMINLLQVFTTRQAWKQSTLCFAITAAIWCALLYPFSGSYVESWFRHNESRFESALAWLRQNPPKDDKREIKLPNQLANLVQTGGGYVYSEDKKRTWYVFPVVTYMIDNTTGFAWTDADIPPPAQAFHGIIRTKRLGRGWYQFWST